MNLKSHESHTMPEDEDSSLTTTGVGSRFVTEQEITSARQKQDEEWKAAYARSEILAPQTQY